MRWGDGVGRRGGMGGAVGAVVVVTGVEVVVEGVGEGEVMFYPVLSCYLIFVQVIECSNEQ